MKVAVLGAGAWGTALAVSLAPHHRVTLWARDAGQVETMRSSRCNRRYLPEAALPRQLNITHDLNALLEETDLALLAVPVAALRETLQQIAAQPKPMPVVWLCKGFESESAQLPHQVVAEALPHEFRSGVLSGPSFALEVARGLPTALTLASNDATFAEQTAAALHHARLRVYCSTDVVGVEVGGAVKNVLAIACGIVVGRGLGENARAAVITRGLAEMIRLGLAKGARAETFSGLSGLGDLVLTCSGGLSRNYSLGLALGRGESLERALAGRRSVVEGVATAAAVVRLAARLGVEMPICEAVEKVLHHGVAIDAMTTQLLHRPYKDE